MTFLPKFKRVTYAEDFALDFTKEDVKRCRAVKVQNGALTSIKDCALISKRQDFKGILGAASQYLYLYGPRNFIRYKTSFLDMVYPKTSADAHGFIYRDKPYITFDNDCMFKREESGEYVERISAQPFLSETYANERLVVLYVNGFDVGFGKVGFETLSEKNDALPETVTLPSKCQALQGIRNNVVYALGPACYKITLSGNLADVKVTCIAQGLGEVVAHTVKVIGDGIYFASNEHMYMLKNDKITRIFCGLDNVTGGYKNCRASLWQGYYVLSAEYNGSRMALLLDADKEKCCGVLYDGLSDIADFDRRTYAVFADGTFRQVSMTVHCPVKFFRSGIDFGVGGVKYLRSLQIKTKCDVDVYITDSRGTHIKQIKGGKKLQNIPVTGCGSEFSVEIRSLSDTETEITCFKLTADVYSEVNYGN